MANFALKMKLIVWKNLIIRKRRWIFTTFEIVVPVLLYVLLASLKTLMPDYEKHYVNEANYYQPYNDVFIQDLYFAPNNTYTEKIMDGVEYEVRRPDEGARFEYRGFDTEESMLQFINDRTEDKDDGYSDNIISVVFNNVPNDTLPDSLDYRIRGRRPYFNLNELFTTRDPFQSFAENDWYFETNFIKLQRAVDSAFIKLKSKRTLDFSITSQRMPVPPHWETTSVNFLFSQIMPTGTVFAFMLVLVGIIQRIMEEKASGIKELMKMMGLKSWMIWVGWYLHSILVVLISTIAITIIMKVPFKDGMDPMVKFGDGFLLWIFFFLYATSGICFCFMVSTWFKKPMLGSSVGTVVWTITIVPFFLLDAEEDPNSLAFVRNLVLLLPNSCINFGFKTLYEFEQKGTGMQWDNLYEVPDKYSPYHSIGKIFIMLIVDSIIFLLLTWYTDNVNPGEYGIRKSWTFPFERSYWCPRVEQSPEIEEDVIDSRNEIEEVSPDLQTGIKIRNLNKEFNKKKAVNNLNFDIYNNQITVLLGHNGAGKTTTMNIVTGMISPTSGSVLVDGYSVQTNIDQVRESLGLCPQHNVQFPDLTTVEHLMFFAMLKGLPKAEAKKESLQYLARLCMTAKANERASTLSGGMRRRLSLGMALVGHTKVLMLDEPTSGMDPEARREIWDLLLSMRGERTILITTHYMEEADILGDRIAIMHSGQLTCYGTSLFLKKHYGTGYTLSVLLSRELDVDIIKRAITEYVPNATVKNATVGSVKFELPTNDTSALSDLFLNLEKEKEDLGIASFGVSITTMDDVFLKVGKLAEESHKLNGTNSETNSETMLLNGHHEEKQYNVGFSLVLQQFWALILKRVQYTRHKLFIFIIGLLLPISFELLTIYSSVNDDNANKNDSKELHLGMYSDAISFYSVDKGNKDLAGIAEYYAKIVSEQNAISTKTEQVSDAIISFGEKYIHEYHTELITAAEFNYSNTNNKIILNAMYGGSSLQSPPISLNLITNAVLKYMMDDEKYSITFANNPLPYNSNFGYQADGMIWISVFPVGVALFIAMLLGFHTAERLSGVKHLQIMSGISRVLYWLNNYLIDMILYVFVTAITILILFCLEENMSSSVSLQAFAVLMILFGLAAYPFSYFFHYRPTAGSVVTYTIWTKIIFGTLLPLVVISWENVRAQEAVREAIANISMLCPHFAFSYGLNRVITQAAIVHKWDSMSDTNKDKVCADTQTSPTPCCEPNSQACDDFYNFFTGDNSILAPVLFLTVEIFVYFALFLIVDYGFLRKYFDKLKDLIRKTKPIEEHNLDSDVVDEKHRVAAQINEAQTHSSLPTTITDVLLVSNLRKWFANFHAVRGLNFGVKERECFGLLGINGAGKTTTFKMLTGEMFLSTGNAKILEFSLFGQRKNYLKQIGYCPQFDGLNFQLTTRQMLTFFAHLRGIPKSNVNREVNKWLERFDIMQYQNIQSANLSGGNKRKLSTAMALIGDPPLIMLDEPTSGVDPVARRNLWGILSALRKSGQAIVLTSHSMDECEALCDRLAIMVDGQMKCIGDIQYLKNKFGQGFTVMLKLRHVTSIQNNQNSAHVNFETEIQELKNAMVNKYACTLKDEHKGMLMYHITDNSVSLGHIFSFMEGLKQSRAIVEDFTVGDTSLEQVFLSFAKDKIAADDKKVKKPEQNGDIV